MLDEIAQDQLARSQASNQPMFATDVDYDAILVKKDKLLQEWKNFDAEERRSHGGLEAYESKAGIPDLKDPALIPAKNTALLINEVKKRIDREEPLSILGIDPLDFED